MLDITDVLGSRVIETAYHGRIGVRAENAAAALEVMSRFADRPALAGLPAADDEPGAGIRAARPA